MGQAARRWHHRCCRQSMERPDAPTERFEQVPRRPAGNGWDALSRVRFATDSLLEGSGFEPSVPLPRLSSIRAVRAEIIGRSTDVFRRDREFDVSALQGRLSTSSQSQCSTDPGLIAGTWHRPLFLTRDRWFESGSLQRRVTCEPVSRVNSPSYVEKPRFPRVCGPGRAARSAETRGGAATSCLRAVISLSGYIPVPHRR